MRYRVGLVVVGVVVLLCSVAWYARPIIAAHDIGIPWRATRRQSHCVRSRFGEYCSTNWPVRFDAPTTTTLDLEPRTRSLMRAERAWNLLDSTTWARVLDSTRQSFTRRRWEQLPCDSTITHFPIAEAWRTGSYEIQLYAAPTVRIPRIGARAYLSVQLLPYGGGSCGPRYGSRLLTPEEMTQRVDEWLSDKLGLW